MTSPYIVPPSTTTYVYYNPGPQVPPPTYVYAPPPPPPPTTTYVYVNQPPQPIISNRFIGVTLPRVRIGNFVL